MGPYIAKIKERYGDDSQAVNVATAKLYEMTETNPLAGCLPSIAQIPIFIALYREKRPRIRREMNRWSLTSWSLETESREERP